jgi:hypothetical protein
MLFLLKLEDDKWFQTLGMLYLFCSNLEKDLKQKELGRGKLSDNLPVTVSCFGQAWRIRRMYWNCTGDSNFPNGEELLQKTG